MNRFHLKNIVLVWSLNFLDCILETEMNKLSMKNSAFDGVVLVFKLSNWRLRICGYILYLGVEEINTSPKTQSYGAFGAEHYVHVTHRVMLKPPNVTVLYGLVCTTHLKSCLVHVTAASYFQSRGYFILNIIRCHVNWTICYKCVCVHVCSGM